MSEQHHWKFAWNTLSVGCVAIAGACVARAVGSAVAAAMLKP